MSIEAQVICFAVALACFIVDFAVTRSLIAAGLAMWVLVSFWTAAKAL